MKKIYNFKKSLTRVKTTLLGMFVLTSLLFSNVINGQTALNPGDIAILLNQGDTPDNFAFVTFVDMEPGTAVYFTDCGADGAGFNTPCVEGAYQYTVPAGGISAGDIIKFDTNTSDFTVYSDSRIGNFFAIATSGDQIIVFQDASNPGGSTNAGNNPAFIFASNIASTLFTGNKTDNNETGLPAGLSDVTSPRTALGLGAGPLPDEENDNVVYNGTYDFSFGGIQAAKLAFTDPSNYTSSNSIAIPTYSALVAAIPSALTLPVQCTADAGTLTADATPVQLSGADVTISATQGTAPTVPTNYEVAYVLTSGPTLIIEQTAATPEFVVDAAGDYTIHTLVAELTDANDPNFLDVSVIVPGTTTGGDVLDIVTSNGLCAALDVAGAPIVVETCTADAGTLTADATPVQLAGADVTISATQGTAPTVPTNYEVAYVLTSGPTLIIEQTAATPEFVVDAAGDYTIHTLVAELTDANDPNFLDVSVIVPGTTTGGDVLDIVTSNGLCAALDVAGAPIVVETCTADAGTLTADATPVQLAGADVTISATQGTAPTVPTNYEVAYVLTSGPTLIIEQTAATPEFVVDAAGDYTIHTLVAELTDANDPNFLDVSVIVPGTTTGGDVLDIVTSNGLCAALDVAGAPIVVETCTADAGTLTADATPVQLAGADVTISATQGTAPTVPTNYEVAYVLTSGPTLIIEQTAATPEFVVDAAGDYTIHTLVAELTDANDPNFLDVSVIVPGTTTGGDVLDIVTSNGLCAALDVAGAPIVVETCTADAGTLTADATPVQLAGADVTISATQGTAPTVPTNYEVAYVLTSGPTLIIEQTAATPEFVVDAAGDYTIHTLVAELTDANDPNFLDVSVIVPGTTTGGDVLDIVTSNGLCAALDVAGAPIVVETCTADAGTLTADATPVQLAGADVTISATQGTAPTVPTNYEVAYVLTSGPTLIIEQTAATPEFVVDAAGDYTIHTLVAELTDANDPNFLDVSVIVPGTTTGGDVLNIVTSNGLCAALDVAGAPIVVETCTADAGTLTADATPVQLAGADVTISATQGTAPTVPTNYEVAYVLTSGPTLIIEQTAATPEFVVDAAGDYTIHTLVAELTDANDPNFLDVSVIVPGTTTGGDVLDIVTSNGLCAALDVAGAPIVVETCTADAGTLTADATPVQLAGADVTISATQGTAPTVPTNYEVAYVLTSGPTLIIEQTAATPEFVVDAAGDYTIHTLVAELTDANDPNFLDVSVIVPGTTTGGDVLDIVTSNGLCAALDVAGAPIVVETCTADAGTLTADATPVQLAGADVTISATQGTAPTVPTNYEVAYVLTSGPTLIIEQTAATPEFVVDAAGDYTIHTLVAELTDANDPNFLDVSVIVPGTTTGGDVLDIVTSNGLCAALDVAGAPIVVESCTADAGTLTADASPVELTNGTATISATQGTAPTVPAGYEVAYVLTSGPTLIIEQTAATPEFVVTTTGDYTIHTLVAELSDVNDPNYLDLSVIVPGTTTGGDVLNIVTSNGICAALDVTGASIAVQDSLSIDDNELNGIKIYPNPVVDYLNITNSNRLNIMSVDFYDVSGRIVKSIKMDNSATNSKLDISEFNSGVYFMILNSDDGQLTKQLLKK